MVQISEDEFYVEPNQNELVTVKGDNGQMNYIYKTKQSLDKDIMIIYGEAVPIKIKR